MGWLESSGTYSLVMFGHACLPESLKGSPSTAELGAQSVKDRPLVLSL